MHSKHIELLVDEPVAGYFYWVLIKPEAGGHPVPVEQAPTPLPSRSLAMMAGIAALQRRTESRRGCAAKPSPDTLH